MRFFKKSKIKILKKIQLKDLNSVPHKDEIIPAKVLNVYDGDTFTVVFLYGNKVPFKINIRLFGVDAPEIKTPNQIEKNAANCVKEYVSSILNERIIPIQIQKWDKYGGRIVAKVFLEDYNEKNKIYTSLSDDLIDKGYGKPYTGKVKKDNWNILELKRIISNYNSSLPSHNNLLEQV